MYIQEIMATNVNVLSNVNELEGKFVQDFYRQIAPHISGTKHKPWPKVAEFLSKLPRGSLVADVGMYTEAIHNQIVCSSIRKL